mmetsp:Transcript_5265/g.8680  ORF Transcript_5265/g.8680 Transcript_5265/m.8680 type:complete len:413 (+) Transcript_5265:157-1395(+)
MRRSCLSALLLLQAEVISVQGSGDDVPTCGCSRELNRDTQTAPATSPSMGSAGHFVSRDSHVGNSYNPMVYVEGGMVTIGTSQPSIPEDGEGPRRKIQLTDFYINKYEVSNNEYREFVDDTQYVTESEKFGWSFVFEHAIPPRIRDTITQAVEAVPWWLPVQGAYWFQPTGPGSDVFAVDNTTGADQGQLPVVQVSWHDAEAFCRWKYPQAGGLPTEAQWEIAARGGGQRLNIDMDAFQSSADVAKATAVEKAKYGTFPWGEELVENGAHQSNVFQGVFPQNNTAEDGFEFLAPVTSFPAQNSLGLHNIIGNAWEWTADWWETRHQLHKHYEVVTDTVNAIVNAEGLVEERKMSFVLNPNGPPTGTDKVKKGGSFLCHHSYCNRYRIAARTQSTPDSAAVNLGFRCARSGPA